MVITSYHSIKFNILLSIIFKTQLIRKIQKELNVII